MRVQVLLEVLDDIGFAAGHAAEEHAAEALPRRRTLLVRVLIRLRRFLREVHSPPEHLAAVCTGEPEVETRSLDRHRLCRSSPVQGVHLVHVSVELRDELRVEHRHRLQWWLDPLPLGLLHSLPVPADPALTVLVPPPLLRILHPLHAHDLHGRRHRLAAVPRFRLSKRCDDEIREVVLHSRRLVQRRNVASTRPIAWPRDRVILATFRLLQSQIARWGRGHRLFQMRWHAAGDDEDTSERLNHREGRTLHVVPRATQRLVGNSQDESFRLWLHKRERELPGQRL
mmetsp:Transcript_119083/g.336820  ORF Transcript_119083/g.336820 Transcript_119083/m.336820 type:complete len:285 (+) Transcript_119083:951-1805(+)